MPFSPPLRFVSAMLLTLAALTGLGSLEPLRQDCANSRLEEEEERKSALMEKQREAGMEATDFISSGERS